ncbi:MAG: hypothetical protein U0235_34305 [Polyangiaceae bacterium]
MMMPTSDHLLFIPGVLLVGIVLGYMLGVRAARADIEKRKNRART